MRVCALALLLMGCVSESDSSGAAEGPDGLGDRSTDMPNGDGVGPDGGGGDVNDDGPAAVVAPSDDDCPDLTKSHTTSFSSSGEERVVTVVVPDDPPDNMPVVFFFHGLLDPGSTPRPTEYMANALRFQDTANEAGVAFILPQSGTMQRMGFSFYMWAADEYEGADVVLYDDLRSCADQQLDIDLYNVHAMGFSGGGLFTTVIARDRGDTLASIIEMSGGADIDMLTFDYPLSVYETPASPMPALLISGGQTDAWPGGGLELVNFSKATDALEDHLVEDGHFVVRCEHSSGHEVPMPAISMSWDWITAHSFGKPSPYAQDGLPSNAWTNWCEIAN